jgi:hypothetical protein
MSGLATQPARANGEFAIGGDLPVVRLGLSQVSVREVEAARAITPIVSVRNQHT